MSANNARLSRISTLPKMGDPEYAQHLKGLKNKMLVLHSGQAAATIVEGLDRMIGQLEASPERRAELDAWYKDRIAAMRAGDAEARAEVTKIRLTRISNYLIALSNWMPFFDIENLADDEIPYWMNESAMEVRVAESRGPDGGVNKSRILKFRERHQVLLYQLATEMYEYPLWDPYRGNVADEVKALIDLSRDLNEKVSQNAGVLVKAACVAAFTTTGNRKSRTFFTHSSIVAADLPTTNRIDGTGFTPATTRFSKPIMDAIIAYGDSWGNLFGAPLRPKMILMPAKDVSGYLADVTFTSQTNGVTEQLLGRGRIESYAGVDWEFYPDVTLASGDGFAYVMLGKIGKIFFKPGGDIMYDEVTNKLGNLGEMGASKWVGMVAPLPLNPLVLRIKYK